jgi:hypothetical protein
MQCSSSLPLVRRLGAVLAGLGLSLFLFRSQVASGLVTRGDDMLARGELARARTFYRRALVFDPRSSVASERLTFAALLMHTRTSLRECVTVAGEALAAAPVEDALLVDRALCRNALREYAAAARDFAELASRTRDGRYRKLAQIELRRVAGAH